jgi:acyl-CoA oxidase
MESTLREILDGDQAHQRNRVREWLGEPGNAPAPTMEMHAHREQVLAWARELAAEGTPGAMYPEPYGRDDIRGSVAAFESCAWGDLSLLVKIGVQFGLFGGAIHHLGTGKHHEKYLRDVGTLELPGCFAMTESGHGSNVQELGTTATYDPDTREFVVDTPDEPSRKDYIGNAAEHGRMAAVFAQLIVGGEGRGVHALLVPIRDEAGEPLPGVRIEDCGAKLGLDGVDNGILYFDEVRVPRDALLDRYAEVREDGTYFSSIENPTKRFFTMLGTLVQGRVSVCGAAVNATKVAQVIAVRHGLTRKQFGPPGEAEVTLMRYRTHQRRLLPDLATTYALHFAQDRLRDELHEVFTDEQPEDRRRRQLETFAAGLKATATWHATQTIQRCREACGGAGYLRANRFAALKADTDVFTTFEGDNTVLLQLVAKNLLTDYRDQFGELDPLGMAQFFAEQVIETVAERSALREVIGRLADDLIPGRDEEEDLLERDTQMRLFRWRQEHILGGAARRLRAGINGDSDPFDVLVDTQDHIIEAARAWVDLVVIEAFQAKIESLEAGSAERALLDRVCSLYALSRIEAERAWYQEHGRLSSTRSKAVIKAVNTLCADLAEDAGTLVEAFGIPQACLGDATEVPGS